MSGKALPFRTANNNLEAPPPIRGGASKSWGPDGEPEAHRSSGGTAARQTD